MSAQNQMLEAGPPGLITLPVKCLAIAIFLIAILYMAPVYFSHDNDWILYMAQQLSLGKTAYVDFYEVNPPLIIWLNLPPAFLSEFMGLSLAASLKAYMFSIIGLVLIFTVKLIELCKPRSPQALFLTITFVLTIFPAAQFAQREHIMLVLLIPYIFLIAARAERKDIPKRWIALIAIIAAIAICIKPYFILIPAICEAYLLLLLGTQTFKRIEPYIMVAVGLLYLLAIMLVTPEYVSVTVKHARVVYHAGVGTDWKTMASALAPFFIACTFTVIASFYLKPKLRNISAVYIVVFLVAAASLGIFVIQFKGWPNHIYPLHAMAMVIVVPIIIELYKSYRRRPQLIILVLGILFLSPVFKMGLNRVVDVQRSSEASLYFENRIKAHKINSSVQKQDVESVLIISAHIFTGFPFTNESGLQWGSRLPSMWMTPGIQRIKASGGISPELVETEKFSHETIGEDIKIRKPDIIFVHVSDVKVYFDAPYDYIADYSRNPVFKSAWSNYKLEESDGMYALYSRK